MKEENKEARERGVIRGIAGRGVNAIWKALGGLERER
jgi:hypothetical protein